MYNNKFTKVQLVTGNHNNQQQNIRSTFHQSFDL